jgi:hypothetical protein
MNFERELNELINKYLTPDTSSLQWSLVNDVLDEMLRKRDEKYHERFPSDTQRSWDADLPLGRRDRLRERIPLLLADLSGNVHVRRADSSQIRRISAAPDLASVKPPGGVLCTPANRCVGSDSRLSTPVTVAARAARADIIAFAYTPNMAISGRILLGKINSIIGDAHLRASPYFLTRRGVERNPRVVI